MKKYNDVDVAVWVATAIMTYNTYTECARNNEISMEKLYFTQSKIRKESKEICNKNVQNPRIQQWYNGDHNKNTYNYLRAKGNLRRIAYIGEFNGEKEYPEKLDKNEILKTINGDKSVNDILSFLKNEYKDLVVNSNENYCYDILNFLNQYSNRAYGDPSKEKDPTKKLMLENIRNKGRNVWQLFRELCSRLEDDQYKKVISSSWLKGNNTEIRKYLWIELKKKDKEQFTSSISIFAEKEGEKPRFRVALEIKNKDSNENDYLRHNRFLDHLDISSDEFEYFGTRDNDLNLEDINKNEISNYILKVKNREINKIQIGKTISYDFVKDNDYEDVINIMKDTINRLEKYYDMAVDDYNLDKDKDKDEDEIMRNEKDICKNTILYGPPGTGKTYNVAYKALEIINYKKYKDIIEDKTKREEVVKEFNKIKEDGLIGFCTFHQSYSYEDFIEGLRSDGNGGFESRDGIFKQICKRASVKPQEGLAKYNFDENNITVHKMSLGDTSSKDDNIIFNYCIENNCLALGYGMDVDYSNCKDREDIKDEIRKKDNEIKDNDFNITSTHRFKNIMKSGDIVIISSGNLKIRAIAKITGDYYYDSNTDIPYNHFRKVDWLYYGDLIGIDKILKDKRLSQASIYTFDNKDLKFDNIKELISYKPENIETKNYVLIIDEINRGNISKIFGELITLIEDDKRIDAKNELTVTLPYSNDTFGVPSNLYIIGTMNTADRSIALLDTALRRRFDFIEYMPDEDLLPKDVEGINVSLMLKTINDRIEFLFDRDHKIGHAYFIKDNMKFEDLIFIMKNKVIPLLQEYFYDDFEKIELILGGSSKGESNQYLLNKSIVKASDLFKGNLSSMYQDQIRYSIAKLPTKEAFIRIYNDKESSIEE